MEWKKSIKRTCKWLSIGLVALLLFLTSIFALAQTGMGKARIEKLISATLTKEGKRRVEIGQIGGLIPFTFRLGRVALSDNAGQWLAIEGFKIRWSPVSLLWGHLSIKELSASLVQLDRLPQDKEMKDGAPRPLPPWPPKIPSCSIERMVIERLALGKALLGEAAVFSADAKLMARSPKGERTTSLRLGQPDGTKTLAMVTIILKGKGPVLAVDAEVKEAVGTLAAAALGIKGPLAFSLHGEGPLWAWTGDMRAALAHFGDFHAKLALESREEVRLTAQGTHKVPAGVVPTALEAWLGTELRFDLAARHHNSNSFSLDHLTIQTKGFSGELTGSVDKERKMLGGHFTLTCGDLKPLGSLVNLKARGSLTVEGDLSGPILQPRATANFNFREVEIGRLQVGLVEGNLRLGFLDHLKSPLTALRLEGNGKLEGLVLQNAEPLPETRLTWQLTAEGPLQKAIQLHQLKLAGDNVSVELSGRLHPDGLRGIIDAVLEVQDLGQFAGMLGYDVYGSTRLKARLERNTRNGYLSAHVWGNMNISDGIPPFLAPLAGTEVSYTTNLALIDGKKLTVSELRLDTLVGKVTTAGSLDLEGKDLDASFSLIVPRLELFSPLFTHAVGGSLRVDGVMKGPLTRLKLDANAVGRDLLGKNIRFKKVSATLHADELSPRSRGRISMELLHEEIKVVGMTHFALDRPDLVLSKLSVKAPGSEIAGNVTLDLERHLADGALEGRSEDLLPLSSLFGDRIKGSAGIKTRFKATDAGQQVVFELEGRNVAGRFGRAGNFQLKGDLKNAFKAARGTADLEVKDLHLDPVTFTSLALSAKGNEREATFIGGATGYCKEPFEIETSGLFTALSGAQRLKLNRLQAQFGRLPLALARPVTIERSPNTIAIEDFFFNVGEGYVEGSGAIGDSRQTFNVKFKDLPVGALQLSEVPVLTGRATGSVNFLVEKGLAQGDITLRINELGLGDPKFQGLPHATVEARAGLRQGKLHSEFILQGLTATPFEASLVMPLNLSFSPLAWSLPPGSPMRGNLSGELDLARILTLVALDDQSLEGRMELNLTLEGTVEEPKITGQARMEKGSYENAWTGTVLKDIELAISATAPRLQIVRARASDGGSGVISAQGWFDIMPSRSFPFSIEIILEQATLLRHDDASATVDGELTLTGSLVESMLAGQLQVNSAELRIPKGLPPEMTEVEVTEIRGTGQETETRQAPKHPPTHMMKLDVLVMSPGHVFARGRGLDSEWKGELKASGGADEPAIKGRLSLVRGRVNFLGKRFTLKRGSIVFDGVVPPSPQLDVLAEASAKDMTAWLQLSGTVAAPKVDLSSEPSLPSDEILSRLLFGRSITNITPVQAIRLAQAVNVMAGGGGFDFLERTRRLLGIDQLEVKQAGEDPREATLSAGKYVTEKVYVEVERGIGAQSGKATVELELTPNISVETEVGANSEGGVGLNWKWHY